ncbi:MAG TPA: GAF and ANTAR domain-containing protein [Mycobacterium sp.]|jgi:GAF domain-containing protein|nr:GAF and ANTAR domain-containing protein [Mycobacterium sp.]
MADYDAQPGRTPPPQPALSDEQLEADDVDLHAGLSGVAGIVAGARPVSEILGDIAKFAVQAIPGADGAGATMVSEDMRVESWSVTVKFVRDIDTVQYEVLGEGPCVTCMESRRPAVSGSLGSDRRWPQFGGRVARMGVHSALALPLMVGDQVIGAINSYAYERDSFAAHAVELGSQFAGPAAVSLYNAQLLAGARERTRQLQRALVTRSVIDQALGIIRARSGVSNEEAFERLTRMSQNANTKLYVVAEQLVDEAVRRARARRS